MLTLFHPADGRVRVTGVTSTANTVLHPWLQEELSAVLATRPTVPAAQGCGANRAAWLGWQAGLTQPLTFPAALPPVRMLLSWDNVAGQYTPAMGHGRFSHGRMPLYTPLSGSWLTMSESVQRILTRRAVAGQHPQPDEASIAWLEAPARGWTRHPTPFVWGGKRALRRARGRERRHGAGGAGAGARQPVRWRRPSVLRAQPSTCRPSTHAGHAGGAEQWQYAS